MSKIGAILFFLIIIVAALGMISLVSEYFLGKHIIEVIQDFLLLVFRKQ